MTKENDLWAKSARDERFGCPMSIFEHCRDVFDAARALWAAVEADLAAALGCDREELRREIKTLLLIAALLHDIGKANTAFQAMVRNPAAAKKQPVRHEILSAAAISRPELLGKWLSQGLQDEDAWALCWAVAGHHLKIRQKRDCEREDPLFRTAETPKEITIHLGHSQVRAILDEVQSLVEPLRSEGTGRPELVEIVLSAMEDGADGLKDWVGKLVRDSRTAWKQIGDEVFRLRLALLKALLVAADVAGSALIADGRAPKDWIPAKLSARVTPEVLEPIIQHNLKGRVTYPFQDRIAASDRDATVVMAGCGNGKTTAAYMWAKTWAKGKKLFFCYPTTGTASAGFEDYLLAQDQLTRDLIHGRAWVDLRAMRDCPDDGVIETANRLESLSAWGCQAIACTVDTVLGLIQNQSRPLFSFPAIACGAFVFDEVHSYDRRLFEELLIFLRTFPGAPVLLMSASIPPERLAAIREALGDRMGEVIKGDEALEKIERYRIEMRPSAGDCWGDVGKALGPGSRSKVLWVCNTVGDAQGVLKEARKRGIKEESLILYHSRLRYRNRVERQEDVLAAFDAKSPKPCLAITTQVCEMSLDISADLLVTALAPLPSLVQRLGRLNRRATHDDPWPCLVYPFEGKKPYDTKEALRQMEAARSMIGKMGGKPYRQCDLASYMESMGIDEEEAAARKKRQRLNSAWLDGGWESEPLPVREGDTSLTVILEDDIPEILETSGMGDPKKWNARNLVPWTVPILAKSFRGSERRAGPYPVAPKGSIDYDEMEGVR